MLDINIFLHTCRPHLPVMLGKGALKVIGRCPVEAAFVTIPW